MAHHSIPTSWGNPPRLRPTLIGTVLAVHGVMFLGLSQLRQAAPPAKHEAPVVRVTPEPLPPPEPVKPVELTRQPQQAALPAHKPEIQVPSPDVPVDTGPAMALDTGPAQPTVQPGPAVREPVLPQVGPSQPQHIGLVCAHRVEPEMPVRALREGLEGVVRATAVVSQGRVTQVRIVSGPKVFHQAVMDAMRQYQCADTPGPVEATQEFSFQLKE